MPEEYTPKTLDDLSTQAGVDTRDVQKDIDISGTSPESAIGNVLSINKKPVSMISSEGGEKTLQNNVDKLNTIAPISTETGTEKKVDNLAEAAKYADATSMRERTEMKAQSGDAFTFDEAAELFGEDFTGLTRNEEGNFVPSAEAYERIGITGMVEDTEQNAMETAVEQLDTRIEGLVNDLTSYNVDQDPAFQSQATNIRNEYNKMRREMEQINQSRQAALATLGYRTGVAQYAGGIQSGIIGEEITQANERMSEITMKENASISAARIAYESGNYAKFSQQVDALQTIRENKADALEQYNEALVNANNALQEQQDFELELAKYYTDIDFKNATLAKPITVTAGSSVFDPVSGEFLGTAPKPLDTKAPEVKTWGGNVHQWNATTQTWDVLGSENEFGGENSATVIDWATEVAKGNRKFSDVPNELKNDVNSAIAKLPPPKENIDEAQAMVDALSSLLDHPGFNSTVGPTWMQRIPIGDIGGAKDSFLGIADQYISKKALEKLIESKSQGATFGALSDTEMAILKSAATKFGFWSTGKAGEKITGFDIDQDRFKEELQTLITEYQDIIDEAKGFASTPTETIDDYYLKNPDKRAYIDKLDNTVNPETGTYYTDEDKLQILEISFNSVGADTNTGTQVNIAMSSGMRTDRSNNPTAFTTDIAKLAGLKVGVDYEVGDPFGNGKYNTAKLLGNPVETTIKVIDNIGFYTDAGKQRWTHTAMSKAKWNRLSYSQKKAIIKKMYQNEGNEGTLNKYFG